MISTRAKADLVEEYRKALGLVNKAAHVLEDASVMLPAAGPEFTWMSVKVIDHMNALYQEINSVRSRISEVKPDAL